VKTRSIVGDSCAENDSIRRLAIVVRGVVQGVGFRPFVYSRAVEEGLSGWVLNAADRVQIEVQGRAEALERFCERLRAGPPQARIEALEVRQIEWVDGEGAGFRIRQSQGEAAPLPTIPADLATCPECLEEIRNPDQRRYAYPFTNCTNCGPRWSIIEGLPYDRPRTSMARFVMCADCRREYEEPGDRRFHAQPIACPSCGPQLELLTASGQSVARGEEALARAAEVVCGGDILALKGLGGFQLVVDATDATAVARLRRRKRRPHKPFAVMMGSPDEVACRCELTAAERQAVASPAAPILLVRRRSDPASTDDIAEAVAPGNPYLGVMLPYTPLHHLMMARIGRPIVCTSGNLSEEPMAVETGEAIQRLGSLADWLLTHNRPIVRPVDDSVARVTARGVELLRRARGFAPLPLPVGPPASAHRPANPNGLTERRGASRAGPAPVVLAVGGHLKNTVGLALGPQAVISSHIGDLDNRLAIQVHRRAIRDLVEFFRAVPQAIACDLHPDYASTREAEQLALRWDVPLVRVQHHEAHVAACVAEHQLPGPVLGLAWDGTGYGPDGTVWGGEVLLWRDGWSQRVAHLRTFGLPGGDRAVREPRRSALGVLFELFGRGASRWLEPWLEPGELEVLLSLLGRPRVCPRTSSMGRLFDGVALLCGQPPVISYEGQSAMGLEYAADWDEPSAYPLPLGEGTPAVADWGPLIQAVLEDRARGVPVGRISARFHNALANLAVAVAQRAGVASVVLTGGCFQNRLLAERTQQQLEAAGFDVYAHRQVPPGDGGIALGQLHIALGRIKDAYDVSGDSR